MVEFKVVLIRILSFGSITVYPALVSGGITSNITAVIRSLTFNKTLTPNFVSSSDIPNLNTTLGSFLTTSNFNTYSTNTNLTLSSIITNLGLKANTADITTSLIGLGNVDNTPDLSKPVSTAVQSGLDTKLFASQLTQFLTHFTMAGGGILTLKLISGGLYLHWDAQILCAPLFNATVYHSRNCPLSGTLATGETATSNGIPLGDGFIANRRFDSLWCAIPSTDNFNEA